MLKRVLKIHRILPITLLLLFSGCAYYNTFYNAQKFYKEAEKERKKRERTQVVELSAEEEAQLKKSGLSGQDQVNRAGQQEMQNYQQAIERASRVLEYFPNSKWVDDALMLLGRCFYYRRDFKKADRKFDELLQLYPNSKWVPEAMLLKAKTAIGMEEYEKAEKLLQSIIDDTKMPRKIREQAKYELGGLYYDRGNYELALENYRSSSRSAEDKLMQAMSLYRMGESLLRLKRYKEAPDVFRRAIKAAPNEDFRSQAMFKLGQAQSLNGDYDHAVRTFRAQLAKEFDEKRIPRLKLELAENLRRQGNLSEAIKWYKEIIELHKRTDASARAYFALGEISEFIAGDYAKAKENYDMVRSEFSNSIVVETAQQRSNNIRALLDLRSEIARLEGKGEAADSTGAGETKEETNVRDDGPIDLSPDGMWANYAGRDRPPPITLRDLTDVDRQRQAAALQRAPADTTVAAAKPAALDSAALAKKKQEEEAAKQLELTEKYLALGELLMFSFNKPDSAIKYYQRVIERHSDSTKTARALYSLAYIYQDALRDTVLAKRIFEEIVELFPSTAHAEGARRQLGLPLVSERVDSAFVLFQAAEHAAVEDNDFITALALYDSVQSRYPRSPFAAKAAFAKAWHLEKSLLRLEEAVAAYERILKQYPDSPYAAAVKPKMAAVEKERKEKEAKEKAQADSIAQAQKPRAPSEEKGTKAEPQLTAASEGKADSASVIQQKAALSNT
ncbi:MAG: tetratricopeptide repeat protein, partial [candidate division KSB1 bacterium]|nr:tetratricopeptide repeat protein [candidate division KSB1 bacterium]